MYRKKKMTHECHQYIGYLFTKEIYKVLRIREDGKQFLLNNNTRRLYSRHELKKVDEVQAKDN